MRKQPANIRLLSGCALLLAAVDRKLAVRESSKALTQIFSFITTMVKLRQLIALKNVSLITKEH